MAVSFYQKPEVLVRDLKRKGLNVDFVESQEGDPNRVLQIHLSDGLMVNWDRDSRSIWAEGPWPDVERLEHLLRRHYQGGIWRKLRANPGTTLVVVVISLLAAVLFSWFVSMSRLEKGQTVPAEAPSTSNSAAGESAPSASNEAFPAQGGRSSPAP